MQKYLPDEEIDNLCDEFEQKLHSHQVPSIESYLKQVDSDRQSHLLYWLLLIELELQPIQEMQQAALMDNFHERFPEFESVINDVADQFLNLDRTVRLPRIPGYTLDRLIKRGGQGAVYRALQDQTGQRVAIKLVSANELEVIPADYRSQAVSRLKKEIRIAASLKHMNVVRIYDAGSCSDGFYFVMQLIEGGNLCERISVLGQFEISKIIGSVADALKEAHAAGILHLDVKPQNILFDEVTDQPLLADFGLARLSHDAEDRLAIAGTLGYMAPEQAMGTAVDVRADVYGLGATLYFLLTGRTAYQDVALPFNEEQRESWLPTPPQALNRDINQELARICMKCLAFDPHDRYQNCQEVAWAIDRFAAAEDGRRIARMGDRAIITSPLFLIINLLVFLQIQLGWTRIPSLEPLIWITMFSMYVVVFFVLKSVSNLDRHTPEHLAMESLWAVWLAKMFAAIAVAGSLRLLAFGPLSPTSVENTVLMCYPMFSALTGLVVATIAPRYWRRLYIGAAVCFLFAFVLMATIAFVKLPIAPLLYGAGATCLGVIWGIKLRQLAREQSRSDKTIDLNETIELTQTAPNSADFRKR
ncbi:MAG: serine/threonine-protein kinase [Pirellulaceae bacterium]|nr:serine/threonine-protein kinase [Pirellulaceae bacterium]